MSPPTFSKSTSMPSGVAAASWAAQSSARWSTAASKPSWSVSSAHFSGAAGDPDDARAVGLGELAGDRTDRAGRGRDDDRLARLRLADVADPDPRGEPGHPERAQIGTRRDALGDVDRQQRHRVRGDRVLLPADETLHGLADRIVRILRRDDLAEPARAHDLTDADRRQVRRRVVDPRAVRRVERDPVDAHERLAVPDLGHRLLAELEGVRADASGGALAEEEAAVSIGHERTVPDAALVATHLEKTQNPISRRRARRFCVCSRRGEECYLRRAVLAAAQRIGAVGRLRSRVGCRPGRCGAAATSRPYPR